MVTRWLLALLAVLALPLHLTAQTSPKASSPEAASVADTLRAMYAAAMKDDLAGFQAVVTPGFYAFDNGARYEGDALMKMSIAYHAKGVKMVWTVNDPDVHIQGDTAWIAYTNTGSMQMSADAPVTPITWLESAYLERHNGKWKIAFFTSARATGK